MFKKYNKKINIKLIDDIIMKLYRENAFSEDIKERDNNNYMISYLKKYKKNIIRR